MNTKEQLEVVARYAGWDNPEGRSDILARLIAEDMPEVYEWLMPAWRKVREELKAIRQDAFGLPISYPAIDRLIECKTALTDRTLSDFLLSLSNAILWIESTKK